MTVLSLMAMIQTVPSIYSERKVGSFHISRFNHTAFTCIWLKYYICIHFVEKKGKKELKSCENKDEQVSDFQKKYAAKGKNPTLNLEPGGLIIQNFILPILSFFCKCDNFEKFTCYIRCFRFRIQRWGFRGSCSERFFCASAYIWQGEVVFVFNWIKIYEHVFIHYC